MPALRFGQFNFDAGARLLTHAGAPAHLTAKAVDLLSLLAARRPEAVAKKDIHAHLWPDTFVSDVSLTTLIFELRTALGESARKPRFIRTVHGFGYAFQGDDPALAVPTSDSPYMVMFDGREIGLRRARAISRSDAASRSNCCTPASPRIPPGWRDCGAKPGCSRRCRIQRSHRFTGLRKWTALPS